MALSAGQVANIRKELRENRLLNNSGVKLSPEVRNKKIGKLQDHCDTMNEGWHEKALQKITQNIEGNAKLRKRQIKTSF